MPKRIQATKRSPRKHNPSWADNTRSERSKKRLLQDDELAKRISRGMYPTLRRLMTAVRHGRAVLVLKPAPAE